MAHRASFVSKEATDARGQDAVPLAGATGATSHPILVPLLGALKEGDRVNLEVDMLAR